MLEYAISVGYAVMMSALGTLETIVAVLGELGGYFVWRHRSGQEYVVIARDEFEKLQAGGHEVQLPLPAQAARSAAADETTADDVLAHINRQIAEYTLQQTELEGAEATDMLETSPAEPAGPDTDTFPPPRRVRFEPLRGDLPPELQE